jgi:hypothetical protein
MITTRHPSLLGAIVMLALVAALSVPTLGLAQPGTTQRPITDFLSQQGTFCAANPGACSTFLASYVAWTQPSLGRIAFIDFAAKESVPGIVTTTSGTITERALADGRAEVHVVLHTRNALTYVYTFDPAGNCGEITAKDPLFGRRPSEAGAKAVGDATLRFTFINSAPGAPLPDLVSYVTCDPSVSIADVKQISIVAHATGPLRAASGLGEGTPGRMQTTQRGNIHAAFMNGFNGGLADGFPVEHINLRAVGN